MTVKELLDAGQLSAAIAQTGAEVRAAPTDNEKRTVLFELLCCSGDLDRAAKQLDVVAGEKPAADGGLQSCRNLLEGERKRRLLFAEGRRPGLPKRVPDYTRFHLEAIDFIRQRQYAAAFALLEESERARSPLSGTINGESFDDLTDADDLLGPFLEVIIRDNYSWIPLEAVRSISIAAPQQLRDLVWIPANIELEFGPLGQAFLPVLYAGSYLHADDRVKLGQLTEWQTDAGGLALAEGQKLLVAGERDWPLLEVRELQLNAPGAN